MRGLRLEKPEKAILKPQDADFNFIVPGESLLREERSKLHVEAAQLGILYAVYDAFATVNMGKDVAVCLDGEETATGIGVNLGEEDYFWRS